MVYVKPRTGLSTVYKVKSVLRGTETEGECSSFGSSRHPGLTSRA